MRGAEANVGWRSNMRVRSVLAALAAGAAASAVFPGCSADPERERPPAAASAGRSGNSGQAEGGGGSPADSFGNSEAGRGGALAPLPDAGPAPGQTCATVKLGVELLPVHLAFAFDVSGSMGKGDKPWHDKSL